MVTVVEHCTFYVDVHYLKFCILILGFLFKNVVFRVVCVYARYWNQIEANIDSGRGDKWWKKYIKNNRKSQFDEKQSCVLLIFFFLFVFYLFYFLQS